MSNLLKLISKSKKNQHTLFVLILFLLGVQQEIRAQNCTANSGGDQTVCGTSVTLNGSVNGTLGGGGATWTFVSGPGVTPSISSPTSLVTSVNGMTMDGVYTFNLSYPCGSGISNSEVRITAHPGSASFTAGPDISGICATVGTTPLTGIIPPGFTGTWTAKNLCTYGNSGNYTFDDIHSATPVFSLINKANHTMDPNYALTLTITSADGVCSYSDDVNVRFCPDPHIQITPVTSLCYNGASYSVKTTGATFCYDSNNPPAGVAMTMNVISKPAGSTFSFDKMDSDNNIYFNGLDIQGDYIFNFTITTCCGTFTTSDSKITFSGTRAHHVQFPQSVNGIVDGAGNRTDVHCGIANISTPKLFDFNINSSDSPSTITTVTRIGELPAGA